MKERMDFHELLEGIILAVESQGNVLRLESGGGGAKLGSVAESDDFAKQKSSLGDLVTELDLEIEKSLLAQLSYLLPSSTAVSEERGDVSSSTYVWIVDPIDGTTNFVHGVRYVGISVALRERGKPKIGVVHNPWTRQTFYAIRGEGSFRRPSGAKRTESTRLLTSGTSRLDHALVSCGLPYDRAKASIIFRTAEAVYAACRDLRRQGSAALDLVSVAEGSLDGHFELDLRPWDIAAAGLILLEAGGEITTWDGREIVWSDDRTKMNVVASNSLVHVELRAIASHRI